MTLARLANVTAPPLPPAPGVQAGRWAKCQTTKPGAVWAQVWLPRGRWLRPQAPTDGRTDGRQPASAAPGPGQASRGVWLCSGYGHFYPAFPLERVDAEMRSVAACSWELGCLQTSSAQRNHQPTPIDRF